MASSLIWASLDPSVSKPRSFFPSKVPSLPSKQFQQSEAVVGFRNNRVKEAAAASIRKVQLVSFAASAALLLCSSPANAGFFSGFSGIESVPGPELPQIDFLSRWNEENQKKYAEADAKFKESPLLKKLLEQTRLNKEKNRQATLDKYCIRGAEWGVGDCSADGMSPQDRDNFISMLKKKAGIEE
ncbi:uncharacterized protein [Coffea arabica]|uniref:Uncharacterized protein n=1 Tax=Coffea arabica TaxID=13443 RepID=A0A6P6UYU5_COFAR|nr:uncharacterized protein LOC113715621 [Coffea arabica]XP_027095675.1 uncharacterized protein LOC113715621 [Coffea arabica]